MISKITEINISNRKTINETEYFLNPYDALKCYIMQSLKKDYCTWDYPINIDGIKESVKKGAYYYETNKQTYVLSEELR